MACPAGKARAKWIFASPLGKPWCASSHGCSHWLASRGCYPKVADGAGGHGGWRWCHWPSPTTQNASWKVPWISACTLGRLAALLGLWLKCNLQAWWHWILVCLPLGYLLAIPKLWIWCWNRTCRTCPLMHLWYWKFASWPSHLGQSHPNQSIASDPWCHLGVACTSHSLGHKLVPRKLLQWSWQTPGQCWLPTEPL